MTIGSISNGDSGSSCRIKINQGLNLWDGLVGAITAYGGSSAPSKWALCDGSAVSRTTYSALFAIIGTNYGSGNGSTTFNLPDLRGKIPVGVNGATFANLGTSVGEETHELSESELPVVSPHTHSFNSPGATVGTDGSSNYTALSDGMSSTNTGSGGGFGGGVAHNNIQPSLSVNYIIFTGV